VLLFAQICIVTLIMLAGLVAVAMMGTAPYDGVMMGRPSSQQQDSIPGGAASSWMRFLGPNFKAFAAVGTFVFGDGDDPCSGGVLSYVRDWVDEALAGTVHAHYYHGGYLHARYRPSCAPTRPS
jgi:hypothetical protein